MKVSAILDDAILVQQPVATPDELILLFHGVGAQPADLVPLATRSLGTSPWRVSPRSTHPVFRARWCPSQAASRSHRKPGPMERAST